MLARSPRDRCRASLAREPLPLYSEALDIAVLWNAKAACTFAIKWLYFQEGLLEEAQAYSPWPHQYRQQVFCKRPKYSDKVRRIPELGPRAIKFVRNPFDRAVGGYLSYCQQAFRLTSPQHTRMLRAIGKHLGHPVGDGQLFTFREFVRFLAAQDLDRADIHVRRQIHPCEILGSLPELTVVRVEESDVVLPQLEDEMGLRRSDIASLRRSGHHTERAASDAFVGDTAFGDVLGVAVPTSRAFYDRELEAAVAELYATDIERYGYEMPS